MGDLVLRFRSPIALFPAILLTIILIAIVASDSTILSLTVLLGIFLVPVLAAFGVSYVQRIRDKLRDEEEETKSKQSVGENWTSLKRRIKQELENKQWIYAKDLSDIAAVKGIRYSALDYAFAKYATENATTTKYASVYRRSDGGCVTPYTKVLINLQNLNHDYYYH